MVPNDFIEGEDFEVTDDGRVVMTKSYLLKRGHCCSSGCKNCPFGFKQSDPTIPQELNLSTVEAKIESKKTYEDPLSDENIQLKLSFYEDQIE